MLARRVVIAPERQPSDASDEHGVRQRGARPAGICRPVVRAVEEAGYVQESGLRDPRDAALELPTLLLDADGVESFLLEVARRGGDAAPRAQSCGITVQADPASPVLGATTDELARRMDEAQYAVDDGPCLTCLRQGVPVSVPDIRADARWPEFTRRGALAGAGSSLSVPLVVRERTVGALNLYNRTAHALGAADQARAARFAGFAAAAVALALRLTEHAQREQHLETALRSRSTIDQAMGVLMGQAHVSADEAFEILRRRSQHANVKLRDVATGVVAEAMRGGDDDHACSTSSSRDRRPSFFPPAPGVPRSRAAGEAVSLLE